MNIYESSEDYLEAILVLKNRIGVVRSIDIVNELGYTKPSVSVAMKKLRESGFISMDESGYITLSESGMEIASKVKQRHEILTEFLMELGVDEENAKTDACKIEHDLCEESFRCIKKHLNSIK